ncbi:MAG: EAL domain-containing protein [Actinomycetales bacterium]|nr:EAL domain-containing protein [Actinomycetales bacterium]
MSEFSCYAENLIGGVLVLDPHRFVVQASPAAARLLGTTPECLVGSPCPVPEPSGPGVPRPRHGGPEGDPAPVRRVIAVPGADGTVRTVLVSWTAAPHGSVVGLVDATQIVPHVDAPDGLDRGRRLTGLVEWELDPETGSVLRSRWDPEVFGLPAGSAIPDRETLRELIHPADREHVCDAVSRAAPGRPLTVRFRVNCPDGRTRHLLTRMEHDDGSGDERRLLVGATLDVTEIQETAGHPEESGLQLDAAVRMTGLASWSYRLDKGELWLSDTMSALLGRDPELGQPTTDELMRLIHPDDHEALRDLFGQVLVQDGPVEFSVRVLPYGGGERFLRCWLGTGWSSSGAVESVWGTCLDVTGDEYTLRDLRSSREELRLAFEEAPTGMAIVQVVKGYSAGLPRMNRALQEMLSLPDSQLTKEDLDTLCPPGAREIHGDVFTALAGGQVCESQYTADFYRPDGSVGEMSIRVCSSRGPDGSVSKLLYHAMDVTEQQSTVQELERLALTDPVTGLDNRIRMDRLVNESLTQVRTGRRALGMLLLGLDRFKVVNDSLGHSTGDALLVEVSQRLLGAVPPGAAVARVGGDEFAVLVADAPGTSALLGLAHFVRERLARSYSLPGQQGLVCTASIGVTRVDDPARSAEDVFREADLALDEAKNAGRNSCMMADEVLRARADERITMEHRLRSALAANGVRIHLQPVVGLAEEKVVGHEALARLEHPSLGLLPPAAFIPVAEETGLVAEVDAQVAELAIAHIARLGSGSDTYVGVNASPRTLARSAYVHRLQAAMEAHGVSPDRLLVEVTESTLLDAAGAAAQGLAAVSALGIRVGIDDFGTGYSALAYLGSFSMDFLKIDRSFVSPIGSGNTRADSIVSAIIALAHAHELVVTAEGVETAEQAEALRRMGCDRGQGWLFGRPAPAP